MRISHGTFSYRQFMGTKLDFTDPATGHPLEKVCLIGANGVGKSTLLRLIRDRLSCNHQANDQSCDHKDQCQLQFSEATASAAHAVSVFCPPEGDNSTPVRWKDDVPLTTLDEALQHGDRLPRGRHFSAGLPSAAQFWQHLLYRVKEREKAQLLFLQAPENQQKTVGELRLVFDETNPSFLHQIAKLWDCILAKAGLEFDVESAEVPVQLHDNLKAYVRLQGSRQALPYAELSTGIRNLIFRLGGIHAILADRASAPSFLFVDEPEGSLHPSFLYDIVDVYQKAAPTAQIFMATHSPIVAAQFKPEERFILTFDDDYRIAVKRGVSPEGDDPNDVLVYDFGVPELLNRRGALPSWEEYRHLPEKIRQEPEASKRQALAHRYLDLGQRYHFPAIASISSHGSNGS